MPAIAELCQVNFSKGLRVVSPILDIVTRINPGGGNPGAGVIARTPATVMPPDETGTGAGVPGECPAMAPGVRISQVPRAPVADRPGVMPDRCRPGSEVTAVVVRGSGQAVPRQGMMRPVVDGRAAWKRRSTTTMGHRRQRHRRQRREDHSPATIQRNASRPIDRCRQRFSGASRLADATDQVACHPHRLAQSCGLLDESTGADTVGDDSTA